MPATPGPRDHSANGSFLLDGLKLILQLAAIRDRRMEGGDLAQIYADHAEWTAAREAWWADAMDASEAGYWLPLVTLVSRLELSDAELNVLLVALAPHIDPEALDHILGRSPTHARLLSEEVLLGMLFPSAEDRYFGQQLVTTRGALRRHGLLDVQSAGDTGRTAEIRVSGSFANFVLGRPLISGDIAQYCQLGDALHPWDSVVLPRDDKARVWEIVAGMPAMQSQLDGWGYATVMPRSRGVCLLFGGPPGTGKTMFAHAIAARLQRQVLTIHTSRLLAARDSIRPVLLECFRVAAMTGAVVLMDDCESMLEHRDSRFLALMECLDRHQGVLVLTTNDASKLDFAMERRIQLRLDFEAPDPLAREQIWEAHLPADAPLGMDIDVSELANAYEFTGARIRNTVLVALSRLSVRGDDRLSMADLRDAAATQLQARLGHLAVKAATQFGLERLVLPDTEHAQMHEVLSACRHREYVLSRWGFGQSLSKGRGLCVLFDGPPGTGKTFAAELLSHELRLPLYRVHIPNIVSKWVGETERNISEIFARARSARAVLLFDEADSLFGRRNQSASGANDRYANMEVNLLLQEIERYDGITFLTTNLFGNLDDALQRRIQFRITFPFPEPEERAKIWRILTPRQAPLATDVDFLDLATRFELAGGHIKNALLRAAYRAREDGDIITHAHLVDAGLAECRAQGKIVRAP